MNDNARPQRRRNFHRLAWLAAIMTASTILFGAFVRLSDAGLSCPDWPTCYGRATWPQAPHEILDHAATKIRPLETHKAWREQVHRILAGLLGFEVLGLALLATRARRWGTAQVAAAALLVAASVPLYMRGLHDAAGALAALGEGLLLFAAWRWSGASSRGGDLSRVAVLALATIVFQALLGMWTVTWLLKPIVVMGHLLGGLTLFALLLWMAWRATGLPIRLVEADALRRWLLAGLLLLVAQIALGGWVSANYAALACGGGDASMSNFPQCVGRWWPPHDFAEGFVPWRGIGVDYEGGVLDGASRIAIQMAHRIGALVVALYLVALASKLLRTPGLRGWGGFLLFALASQVVLGVLNVKLALPLAVAVLHNGGAVLLLFVLVTLLARLRKPEQA
ncbi:COX15/CtaA family protein [Pseudoxanthomonas sangjuensis]|uniref:COX15/CtaA family protein n=1 Tax=Pseudoxanthomonas sangjuensis TaxID=1503750 RepID=UPI0013915E61|nr:COX15/CtaA family protein [Pseudoxanthomonas sangjuensis]KAF1711920.1 heme A synthase [Pseudoxanthomonas sangjuensis]